MDSETEQRIVRELDQLVRRLNDVSELVSILKEDTQEAWNAITARPDAGGPRRQYVRAAAASIEGAMNAMSAYILETRPLAGWSVSDDEKVQLSDRGSTDPIDGSQQIRRSRFLDRTKNFFKIVRRLSGDEQIGDFGGEGYQSFRETVALRDRLVHPKRPADLDVTVDDLRVVTIGSGWFSREFLNVVSRAYAEPKKWTS